MNMYRWFLFLLAITLQQSLTLAIAIDNDIVGEPEIECMEESIRFYVNTRKYFAGRFYAKSKAEVPGCLKADYAQQRSNKPNWDITFGACGMRGLRSLDPRGMYYSITVVVSFHPLFITKVDQAFHVKCFFEESNRGLTAELGVSMIPTTEVQAKHTLPGCTYSMHKSTISDLDAGRPAGEPVKFARVGDKVLHQWACDDPMFGILINNCYVTDGFGQRAEVVDQRGCPIDPILITGIRYSADLMRAYAESHVFKFADKPGVWFFCQIQMCMKAAGMCQGISPPVCDGTSVGGPVGGYVPSTIGQPSGGYPPTTARPLYPYTIGGLPQQPNYAPAQQGGYAANALPGQAYPSAATAFAPAYQSSVTQPQPYPVLDNRIEELPQGLPVGSLRHNRNGFEVTTNYDTEIPLLFEQSDTPGIGMEDENGRWTTTATLAPHANSGQQDPEAIVNQLFEALPDDLRTNDALRKFIMEHKEDQRFLMNALYRARNPDDENGLSPGDHIDSFDVTMLAPMMDDPEMPEIAGQLIIFDLDEDPPSYLSRKDIASIDANSTFDLDEDSSYSENGSPNTGVRGQAVARGCVISARSLMTLVCLLGGVCALFMFSTCAMCIRQCRTSKDSFDEYEQKALPYDPYRDKHQSRSGHGRSSKPRSSSQHHSRHNRDGRLD